MSTRAEIALKALVGFAVGLVVATVGVLQFVDGRIERASARAATDAVSPVAWRIDSHLDEMARLRPQMKAEVDKLDAKLELLLEDCYRRGGCRKQ